MQTLQEAPLLRTWMYPRASSLAQAQFTLCGDQTTCDRKRSRITLLRSDSKRETGCFHAGLTSDS